MFQRKLYTPARRKEEIAERASLQQSRLEQMRARLKKEEESIARSLGYVQEANNTISTTNNMYFAYMVPPFFQGTSPLLVLTKPYPKSITDETSLGSEAIYGMQSVSALHKAFQAINSGIPDAMREKALTAEYTIYLGPHNWRNQTTQGVDFVSRNSQFGRRAGLQLTPLTGDMAQLAGDFELYMRFWGYVESAVIAFFRHLDMPDASKETLRKALGIVLDSQWMEFVYMFLAVWWTLCSDGTADDAVAMKDRFVNGEEQSMLFYRNEMSDKLESLFGVRCMYPTPKGWTLLTSKYLTGGKTLGERFTEILKTHQLVTLSFAEKWKNTRELYDLLSKPFIEFMEECGIMSDAMTVTFGQ